MTTQIPTTLAQQAPPPSEDGLESLYEEVVSEIAMLKKRPASSSAEIHAIILRTVMPIIKDLAYYVRENRRDIDDLMDDEAQALGTQFAADEAQKFSEVVQFALFQAQAIVQSEATTQEQKDFAQRMVTQAEECLKIIEETALDEEGEGEEIEGETEEPAE